MDFIKDDLAATVGGGALLAVAVKNALPAAGQSFTLQTLTRLDVLLPAAGAAALLMPDLFKSLGISKANAKLFGAGVAIYMGGKEVAAGRLFGSAEDALRGPLTALSGVALVA